MEGGTVVVEKLLMGFANYSKRYIEEILSREAIIKDASEISYSRIRPKTQGGLRAAE